MIPIDLGDPEFQFALKTLKKAIAFLVLALAAVGLHEIVEITKSPDRLAITYSLRFLEYAVLVGDVVWFVCFIVEEIGASLSRVINGPTIVRLLALAVFLAVGALAGPHVRDLFVSAAKAVH